MKIPPRKLSAGQRCQVWTYDTTSRQSTLLYETSEILLEAPNWSLDGKDLILNGNGVLWRLPMSAPALHQIPISGVPNLNNDHVLDPDGEHIFLSAYDSWHLYRAPLRGGEATQISGKEGPANMLHFLHGVSPNGQQLAFVGVSAEKVGNHLKFLSADICTLAADGSRFRKLTSYEAPSDGPEYSPDGNWIYFNTELFSGHAQIARMTSDGAAPERLTEASTVDWFPHLSPDGSKAVYLAFPPGTKGHPADLWVELKLVLNGDWKNASTVAQLFGGQGTINVNSWAPNSKSFAYVAYPFDAQS